MKTQIQSATNIAQYTLQCYKMRLARVVHVETPAELISGHVKVRYCKAPVRLRKSVGSEIGAPSAKSFGLRSTGVEHDMQSAMPA